MSTNKTNIDEFDGKLYYSNNTIGIAFYIKYIMLVANIINTIKYCFNISKMLVLIFSFSEFPPEEVLWPLILALQKDPLTKGGKLWLSFL